MTGTTPLLALAALVGVLGLVLLSRRALLALPRAFALLGLDSRIGVASRGAAIALEQVMAVDARRRLVLVRCEGRRVLLLTGGAQDIVVGWLDAPAAAAP